MTCKIHFLPDEMIDQIAAGEVVESPAACMKELIENAIDAKAEAIEIEISQGGLDLIRVSDDGIGMNEEELKRCIQRFATSKIRRFEDLSHLSTLGFRGEALPSIASISKCSILSSDGSIGHQMKLEGGKEANLDPFARTRGTTIEISSLFYNVPARKKFQKSPASSQQEITKLMKVFSIGYPHVEFTLKTANKLLFHSPSESFEQRARRVLPHPFSSQCLSFSFQEKGWEVTGMLGKPAFSQSRPSKQYFFLNNRLISSRMISQAVKEAYGTRIREGEYPIFLLNLKMNSDEVDVNVHPQKKEVRFSSLDRLHQFFHNAVKSAFQTSTPSLSTSVGFTPPALEKKEETHEPFVLKEESIQEEFSFKPEKKLLFTYESLIGSYFLVREIGMNEGEVWVIDLKAAYARLLFEQFSREEWTKQVLLFPLVFDVSEEEIEEVLSWNLPGISLRQSGPHSLAIEEIPSFLNTEEFESLFPLFVQEGPDLFDRKEEKKLALFCSRFSQIRKSGFSHEEARLITERLFECEDPNFSPIGREVRRRCDFDQWFQKRKKIQ